MIGREAANPPPGERRARRGALGWIGERLLVLSRGFGGALACAWAAGISVLSHQPLDSVPRGGVWAFASNGAHVVMFGLLALWLALALPRDPSDGWPRLTRRAGWQIVAAVALFGALDEWHQSFTGRSASPLDWITDLLSAAWVIAVAAAVAEPSAARTSVAARFGVGLAVVLSAAALATWA